MKRWRIVNLRRPDYSVEEIVGQQLKLAMRSGVHDDFQAGYACGLCWTWYQAGLPSTAETIGLMALVEAFVLSDSHVIGQAIR